MTPIIPAMPPLIILGSKENCFACWFDEEIETEEVMVTTLDAGVVVDEGESASLDFIARRKAQAETITGFD